MLLATNELVVLTQDGRVSARRRLGADALDVWAVQRRMALGPDGLLHVLLGRDVRSRPDRVAVVDPISLRQVKSYELDHETTYRVLTPGPRTGQIRLLGNAGGDVVMALLGPKGVAHREVVRTDRDNDLRVFDAVLTGDEKRLFVGYHGADSTGADVVRLSPAGRQTCRAAPGVGCLPDVHGGMKVVGDLLYTATGSATRVDERNPDGRIRRRLNPRSGNNHLMAITADGHHLYALGSCGYAGGLTRVTLSTGETTELSSRPENEICGEQLTLNRSGNALAVLSLPRPVPQTGRTSGSAVLFVDPKTGRVTGRGTLDADPLDVVPLD
ncbi:hypothetical protein FHS44_007296 [Streptosporangium saharense]|uniref:Uncharacterized protein n=1 Tax=Streptosporangium saharense TaxID=1706840 RepID=A0A7W7QUR5_9ACTN|nr:hypothetical protein [Streptosporangium saharense]